MNLDPAPRLNKTYFVLTAVGCLTAVLLIGLFAPNKFAPLPFLSAIGFLLISIVAIMIPIIIDYAADSAEYVQSERGRVTDQVQRLHAATESLARAAAQIKAVEEAVHKTAHAAENLPYRMQEKLAEFNEALAEKETEERDALERELDELRAANATNLKAVADKIAKSTAEWTALETATRKQLSSAQDASAKIHDQLQAALAQLDARIASLQKAASAAALHPSSVGLAKDDDRREAPAAPTDGGLRPPQQPESPAHAEPEAPAARPEPAEGVIESVTFTEAAAPAAEEAKPKKPRAPRKPKPEDTLAAMSAEPVSSESSPAAPAEIAPATASEEPASVVEEAPAKAESSASSDGATRLLVTAYIGIGNKLFIRGDGPGLSWDKGVPMQFVSIGKWGWASHDATAPVKCKLYKNDEAAALSGEVTIEPGKHVEVSALF